MKDRYIADGSEEYRARLFYQTDKGQAVVRSAYASSSSAHHDWAKKWLTALKARPDVTSVTVTLAMTMDTQDDGSRVTVYSIDAGYWVRDGANWLWYEPWAPLDTAQVAALNKAVKG